MNSDVYYEPCVPVSNYCCKVAIESSLGFLTIPFPTTPPIELLASYTIEDWPASVLRCNCVG